MCQRNTRKRICEISRQINDLSLELDRLLIIEDNSDSNTQQTLRRDFSRGPTVGDRVEIINSYIGLFGTTRGSRRRVVETHGDRVSIRLERNGAIVTRGTRNVRVIDREDNARRATQ